MWRCRTVRRQSCWEKGMSKENRIKRKCRHQKRMSIKKRVQTKRWHQSCQEWRGKIKKLKKSYVFRRISRMYWLRIWHNVCQVFSPGVITLVLWPRFTFYLRRGGVATNGGNIADMAVCKLSILMNFLCCPLKSVFDCSCLCCLVSHRWCGGTAHGLKWANGCVPDGIQIFCHGYGPSGNSNPAIPCNEKHPTSSSTVHYFNAVVTPVTRFCLRPKNRTSVHF